MPRSNDESATKTRIRKAAAAVFDAKGVSGLTMRAIAREVGLSPTAIYRHYPNRDAILNDVWAIGIQELDQVMQEPLTSDNGSERMLTLVERYTRWALGQSELYELKHRYDPTQKDLLKRNAAGEVGSVDHSSLTTLVREIERSIEREEWRKENLWAVALTIWSLAHGLISLQRGGQISVPAEELPAIARYSAGLLIEGLRK